MTDKTKYKTDTRRVDGCIITNINNIHDHELFHLGTSNLSNSPSDFFINYQIMKKSKNITNDIIIQLIKRCDTDDEIQRAFKIILSDINEFLNEKNNIFNIFIECIRLIKNEKLKLHFAIELSNTILNATSNNITSQDNITQINTTQDNITSQINITQINVPIISDNCLIDSLNQYSNNEDKLNILKMFINYINCKSGFVQYRVLSIFDDNNDTNTNDKYKIDALQLINRKIRYTGSELYVLLGLFSSDDYKFEAMKIIDQTFGTNSHIQDLFMILQYFTSSKSRRDLVLVMGHKFKSTIGYDDINSIESIRKKMISLFDNIDHYREMCEYFKIDIDNRAYKKSYKVINKNRLSSLSVSDPCIKQHKFFSIEYI